MTAYTQLIIPDLHFPAVHPKAFRLFGQLLDKHSPNEVVLTGDVVDHNSISFWEKFPELPSALDEYKRTRKLIARLKTMVPKAKVCIGNHDERVYRVVRKIGVPPSIYLKEYNAIWELDDGWHWEYEHVSKGILFTHGYGSSRAFNIADQRQMPVVSGHIHTAFEIRYAADDSRLYWGMNPGCLIDRHHPAMEYAHRNKSKLILGCGLVVNGVPQLIPMAI